MEKAEKLEKVEKVEKVEKGVRFRSPLLPCTLLPLLSYWYQTNY